MASQQQSCCDGNEKPFVSVNRDRVGQLDAFKKGPQFRNEAGSAAVTGVDMQPEFLFVTEFSNSANRVHGTRAGRADGCYHGKRKISFSPIGPDMLFEGLSVDAASPKTGNADHVEFADSNLLCSPRNRKMGRLGSINSRNSFE